MAQYTINDAPYPIDTECRDDFVKRTLQNAKNLLMCRAGEVPYNRNRGIDPALFDLPVGEIRQLILQDVMRVMAWEPDIDKVVSASFDYDKYGNGIITAVVEINEEDEE